MRSTEGYKRKRNISGMERIEYQALRKITGAYHPGSKAKPEWIAE